VKELLNLGSNPAALNQHAWNVLHLGAYHGVSVELFSFLLGLELDVNAVDQSGWTPLHVVCGHENLLTPGYIERQRRIDDVVDKEWS
jgi:ankyrin repeat protein